MIVSEGEVVVNPDVEEFLEETGEEGLDIKIDMEHGCFYVTPREDEGVFLSPCLPTQEELEDWILQNPEEILENYDRLRRG